MSEPRDLLVVEDEPVVLGAARRILAPEGLSLELAGDAATALAELARQPYRAVLCDLMLPGASGFELIAAARRADPATQVVVITGYATLENAIRSFQLGAFDFIPKPFDVGELLGVVRRALSYYDLAAAGGVAAPAAGSGRRQIHRLGRHSWAAVDPDGSATLGLAETFSAVLGAPAAVELPAAGEHTTQGRTLARLRPSAEQVWRVWAPLSGRIIAVNGRLDAEPELLTRDPFGDGWLVSIVPSDLEAELQGLAPAGERAEDLPHANERRGPQP